MNINARDKTKHLVFILLVLLVTYITCVRIDLQKNSQLNNSPKSPVSGQWLQPEALNRDYPVPKGESSWSLNYTNIERLVWQFKTDETEQLIINAETRDLLQKISAEITSDLKTRDWQRLSFLIKQDLNSQNQKNNHGGQVADLVTLFYQYQKEATTNLIKMNIAKGAEQLILLKATSVENKLRQERFFGTEIAHKLFSKKNASTNYLISRRIINLDDSLTKTQKKERLLSLKESYSKSL